MLINNPRKISFKTNKNANRDKNRRKDSKNNRNIHVQERKKEYIEIDYSRKLNNLIQILRNLIKKFNPLFLIFLFPLIKVLDL